MKNVLALLFGLFIAGALFRLSQGIFDPSLGPKESYNDFFPKRAFLEKILSPIPSWMQEQLQVDFQGIRAITADALERGYAEILTRLKEPNFICHYRILDNQLFKYIPTNSHLSSRDSYYEKAIKTLLSQLPVPDVDFVLCPMDGIPEAIVPPDFYQMHSPEEQIPLFGQAKLKEPLACGIILIPDQLSLSRDWYALSQEIEELTQKIPWREKIAKAFWRGGISDHPTSPTLSPYTPRFALCRLAKQFPEWIDAASGYSSSLQEVAQKEGLVQCHIYVTKEEHLRFKYLPVLDGNMCTYPGYQWRLLSNSLTLKQESDQIQWFYGALKPYEHYLPLRNDLSDLVEKLQWAETHEAESLRMIAAGQQFAKANLQYEDCYRYLYLVLQRYASCQNIDFASLKHKTKKDPQWVNIQFRKRLSMKKKWTKLAFAKTA